MGLVWFTTIDRRGRLVRVGQSMGQTVRTQSPCQEKVVLLGPWVRLGLWRLSDRVHQVNAILPVATTVHEVRKPATLLVQRDLMDQPGRRNLTGPPAPSDPRDRSEDGDPHPSAAVGPRQGAGPAVVAALVALPVPLPAVG